MPPGTAKTETGMSLSVLYRHMLRGAAWMVLMRWGVRLIGLVSIMILARLLTPADFGVVAMATITIGLISIVTESGAATLVIRESEGSRDLYDTGWTVSIIQGLALAALIVVAAPLAAAYFEEPRVTAVMQCLAVSAALDGFTNIGMVLARKELDYSRDFRFGVYARLLKFCITVPAAFVLLSYWAIVLGHVLGTLLAVMLSFAMHPYRPRLCLRRWRQFLGFSLNLIGIGLGRYAANRADVFTIGRLASSSLLGQYNVALELSMMLTAEIVGPIARALIPTYSKVRDDARKLSAAYLTSLSGIAMLSLPAGLGLAAIADSAVPLLLGAKWGEATRFVGWLAIYATLQGILRNLTQILLVTGRERVLLALQWGRFAVVAPCVVLAGIGFGIDAIPIAATLATTLYLPLVVTVMTRKYAVSWSDYAQALWRPLAAALVMYPATLGAHVEAVAPVVSMLLQIAVGASVYTLVLAALWKLAGSPDSAEAKLASFVAGRIARHRGAGRRR